MADLSEFVQLSAPKRKAHCAVGEAIEGLSGPEWEQLMAALKVDVSEITHAGIAKWLQLRGHDVKWQAVRQHRADDCACNR